MVERPGIDIDCALQQRLGELFLQFIKLPVRDALTAGTDREGQQAAVVDVLVDLLARFAVNPRAAATVVRQLVAGAKRIPATPRIGQLLEEFAPRELRRFLIGPYELRYELREEGIYVLRIFHTREDR